MGGAASAGGAGSYAARRQADTSLVLPHPAPMRRLSLALAALLVLAASPAAATPIFVGSTDGRTPADYDAQKEPMLHPFLRSQEAAVGWGEDPDGQATPPAGLADVTAVAAGRPEVSFEAVQTVAARRSGVAEIALVLSEPLGAPGAVTLSLASGDPADLGGFTSRTVALAGGAGSPMRVVVEVPVTAGHGDRTFAFALSDPTGNEPVGVDVGRAWTGVVVADDQSGGPTITVTLPMTDADGDGAEDGGPRFLALPLAGVTAGALARAAAGDGAPPTVFVLDAAGAPVAAAPSLVLGAGQPVYVDVTPGADLALAGGAGQGTVAFPAVAVAGRALVAVGNPSGRPDPTRRPRRPGRGARRDGARVRPGARRLPPRPARRAGRRARPVRGRRRPGDPRRRRGRRVRRPRPVRR